MKDLSTYRKKRDFQKTPEPSGAKGKSGEKNIFVVQKHDASRLHYDFRIQIGNTLKSWAIPKGPSIKTKDKRLAILTEDHPLSYANFEGEIPKGQYGAGTVLLWDKGTYENVKKDKKGKTVPMKSCFRNGQIEIRLKGKKLEGGFALIHFKEKNWLLIKMKDEKADNRKEITKSAPHSIKSKKVIKKKNSLSKKGKYD